MIGESITECACGSGSPLIHLMCKKSRTTESHCVSCFEEMISSGDFDLVDNYDNVWKVVAEKKKNSLSNKIIDRKKKHITTGCW